MSGCVKERVLLRLGGLANRIVRLDAGRKGFDVGEGSWDVSALETTPLRKGEISFKGLENKYQWLFLTTGRNRELLLCL